MDFGKWNKKWERGQQGLLIPEAFMMVGNMISGREIDLRNLFFVLGTIWNKKMGI